jgi:hypothetical protein
MIQQTEGFESLIHGKQLEKTKCDEVINSLKSTHESPLIELKEGVGDKNKLRRLILRSIVAFLNGEGRGSLIIGVRGKEEVKEIACIPRGIIARDEDEAVIESFIRETIFSHLKGIPPPIVPPHLSIKVFDCKTGCNTGQDGWLVLIYIEKRADVYYYAQIGDEVIQSIRKGSSSRTPTPEEIIRLIEGKRKPLVLVFIKPEIKTPQQAGLNFILYNIGYKPSNYASGVVQITRYIEASTPMKSHLIRMRSQYIGRSTVPRIIREEEDTIIVGLQHHQARHMPLIPQIIFDGGELVTMLEEPLPENSTTRITFVAQIFTEETKTSQKCVALMSSGRVECECEIFIEDYLGYPILSGILKLPL